MDPPIGKVQRYLVPPSLKGLGQSTFPVWNLPSIPLGVNRQNIPHLSHSWLLTPATLIKRVLWLLLECQQAGNPHKRATRTATSGSKHDAMLRRIAEV